VHSALVEAADESHQVGGMLKCIFLAIVVDPIARRIAA
jgi:hypothetical protein